jgi:hypothetical protein
MAKVTYVEWIEPKGEGSYVLHCRMKAEDVSAYVRESHPELTPEQALDEYTVVHWATLKEYDE